MNTAFALIVFMKGKAMLGAFAVFLPGVAVFAAGRLGKPASLCARRFYDPAKLARATLFGA